MPTNKPTSDQPIAQTGVIGHKVETKYEDDGVTVIQPSTLANDAAENVPGHNPDSYPSDGRTRAEQNAVGKGANPSADIVTKNNTTIDPVFAEASPTADGRTIPLTVPASLPVNSPITEPSGHVHMVGEENAELAVQNAGVLKQAVTKPAKDENGALYSQVVTPAEIVYGDEAAALEADKVTAESVLTPVEVQMAPKSNTTFAPNVAPQDVVKTSPKK